MGFKLVNVLLSLPYLFLHPLQKPLFFFNQKCIYQLCPIIRKLFVSICEVRNVNDCFCNPLCFAIPPFPVFVAFLLGFWKDTLLKEPSENKISSFYKEYGGAKPSPLLTCSIMSRICSSSRLQNLSSVAESSCASLASVFMYVLNVCISPCSVSSWSSFSTIYEL